MTPERVGALLLLHWLSDASAPCTSIKTFYVLLQWLISAEWSDCCTVCSSRRSSRPAISTQCSPVICTLLCRYFNLCLIVGMQSFTSTLAHSPFILTIVWPSDCWVVSSSTITIKPHLETYGRLHQHHLTFKSRLIPPLISTLRKLLCIKSTLPLIVT